MLTMCARRFLAMGSKRKRSSKGGADEGSVEGKSDVHIADTSMSSMGMASEPIAGDTLSREERRKLKKQRKKAAFFNEFAELVTHKWLFDLGKKL